jgi:Nif-specific regulatory protein
VDGSRRANDRPSVLLAVHELLRAEVDIDILLARIVDLVIGAMQADRATLFLVDHDAGELYSKVAHLPELAEIRLKIGQGIVGHVAKSGRSVATHTPREDKRHHTAVDAATGYETRSLLAVPVFEHGQASTRSVVGVLEVLNKHGDEAFTPADRELLEALAEQIGEALAVTRLDDGREQRRIRFNKIVGSSPPMRAVYEVIARAASTDATVLILGESGTGKELAARAIHVNSARASGPFIKVDCTSIPEGLIEAELFGHERGAFTGADRMVPGKCELAAGGTLFLDELGELPLALQAKLLRFVQDRELERVGGRELIHADVRFVTATNRDLAEMVARGSFRKDLFYRIKVVELALPPLRDRGPEDIDQLARHFLAIYARKHGKAISAIDPVAFALLRAYHWPGNIRELEHCIESAVVFARGTVVMPVHLSLPHDPDAVAEWEEAMSHDTMPSGLSLADVERRYISRTLAECQGNRTRAAQVLGIGRNTLNRKIKHYGLID